MKKCIVIFSILLFLIPKNLSANKEFISEFLPKNPVILEAGAHIGIDTLEMISLWPKCIIHAFEPVPTLFNKLQNNTFGLPNVHCYPVALSDKNGKADFYVSSGTSDASSSLLEPKDHLLIHQTVYFKNIIEVEAITLDDWAIKNNIDHIDFMWLDMQGYELTMLKASPRILKTVPVIFIEVSYEELYVGTALFHEVRDWFEEQGFQYVCELNENALFVRKDNEKLKSCF